MHDEARSWVQTCAPLLDLRGDVLEFGGRNVNGGVRHIILHTRWVSVDLANGYDVDVVANAATVEVDGTFDVVVSTELLEHTPEGEGIVANAAKHLRQGGHFVATMAGPGRKPHGASGEASVPWGEHYANVTPEELHDWLQKAGFETWTVDQLGPDVRCWARK